MPRRVTASSVDVDLNVRALRVYPVKGTGKRISELKTIGIKLSRDEAIHLARVLLAATQEWKEVEITAYRFQRRASDDTHQITLTSVLK